MGENEEKKILIQNIVDCIGSMNNIDINRNLLKNDLINGKKFKENEIEKPISPKEEVLIAFEIPKSKVIQEYEICPNNEFRFEVIERLPLKQKEKTSKLDNIKTKRN